MFPLPWGIPTWAVKLAGVLALSVALAASAAAYHRHVFEQGVAQERARHDAIDAANSAKAEAERLRLNEQLAKTQADLNAALANLDQMKTELDHEKTVSSQRQADLLAGRERLRVLVRSSERTTYTAGQAQSSTSSAVDQGTEIVADLAGTTASAIDQLRAEHNEAVMRLNGCISAYDAVEAASNK